MSDFRFASKKEVLNMIDNMKKVIEDSDNETYLMLNNDLETGAFLGRGFIDKKTCKSMVNGASSLIINIDDEEDTIPVVSLYSYKQNNPFNIVMKGKKSDIYMPR